MPYLRYTIQGKYDLESGSIKVTTDCANIRQVTEDSEKFFISYARGEGEIIYKNRLSDKDIKHIQETIASLE